MESLYKEANILNSKDVRNIHIEILGSGLEMCVHTVTYAYLESYELLELLDAHIGTGIVTYYCKQFKNAKFIAEAIFAREGNEYIPIQITSDKLEVEPLIETV